MHFSPVKPTMADRIKAASDEVYVVKATIGGTGAQTVNVFQYAGTVRILSQWAEITRIGTLTNLTDMYADIYDGTVATNLTDPGASLAGAQVGTFFTKDKVSTEQYSVNCSDQGRLMETLNADDTGRPFSITAKYGVPNYIRFHYTTTDNPIDFDMIIYFKYRIMNGGSLSIVGA